MNGPKHHLPEELLLAYASGTAPEAVALVVATHNTLCPTCRAQVEALEAVGGAMLDAEPREPVDEAALEAALGRLDEPSPSSLTAAAPLAPGPSSLTAAAPLAPGEILPAPLRAYVGDYDKLRWQRVLPGLFQVVLPLAWNGLPVRLSRVRGGFTVPRHTHRSQEILLVLAGGFTEGGQHFERGDLEVGDVGDEHELSTDRGQDCITLVVNSSRLVQLTFAGRLFGAITGL